MKMIQRCFLSIRRHPVQTLIKFLIVFILGNFMFASIAVQQASVQIKERMLERIPADITLQLVNDTMNRITELQPIQLIEELKKHEDILNVYSQVKMDLHVLNEEIFDLNSYSRDDVSTNYLIAGLETAPETLFDYEFVEGRHLTQEEIDRNEPKVVLNIEVAENFMGNSYHVHDIISLPVYDYAISTWHMPEVHYIDFEIVGIVSDYQLKELYQSGGKLPEMPMIEVPMNQLYEMRELQDQSLDGLTNKEKNNIRDYMINKYGIKLSPLVSYIRVAVNGMDQVDTVMNDLRNNPNYLSGYYATKTSSDDYRYVQAPLENLIQLANITLWGSTLFVVVLLSLISVFFLKERVHEIGIYMSMGERKMNIMGQFMLEIILSGMLAVSAAMISGNALGGLISEQFLKIQVDTDSEQDYLLENPEAITQLDLLEDYQVALTGDYVMTILGSSLLILMISSGLPIVYVLRIKPKNVLM